MIITQSFIWQSLCTLFYLCFETLVIKLVEELDYTCKKSEILKIY